MREGLGDPYRAEPDRDATRRVGEAHGQAGNAAARIKRHECIALCVGHPYGPSANRDRDRTPTDGYRLNHLIGVWVDPRDASIETVGDPDRSRSVRDPCRGAADDE